MRRALLLVLWPRVASGACTTEKKYQLGTTSATSGGRCRKRDRDGEGSCKGDSGSWDADTRCCLAIGETPSCLGGTTYEYWNSWWGWYGVFYVQWTEYGCYKNVENCPAPAPAPGPAPAASNCRSDICTDYGSDCCAPGSEPRGCSMAGYEPQADPDGTSGWGPCVSTYGQLSVYQCCSAGGSSSSKKDNDKPDSASAGFIVAILLLLLVVVLVGGIFVLYKKVVSLENQRRPPTNPGAFFEVGAVELETTSPVGHPPKPGYVPQYPQTAAVEVPQAPYSPPRAQVLTVEPSAPERGTMV